MLNKFKSLSPALKSSIVYTLSNVISKGLVILTTPIFAKIMLTEQIGVVNHYTSWYSIICVVASLSLTSGGYQVAMKEFPQKRDQYQSSVLSLTSLVSLVFLIVFLICPSFWSDVLKLPIVLIELMLFGFFVYPARDFWLARQRYEYKYKLSGVVMIGSALFASAISVFAVLIANKNKYVETAIVRLLTNYLIMYGVAAVIAISIFVKGKTLYNKEYWLFSLSLSLPLIVNSLASQVLNVSDRVMIRSLIGLREVGIYGTIYIVSSASQLVWSSINASFVPYLFENLDKSDKRKTIYSITNGFMIFYSGVAVFITLLAPEIIMILATPEYLEAVHIMPPIAAGIFLISLSNLYTNVLIYHKKTQYVMIATIIAAFINVVLNYFGIQYFGYMAAAYTTLIAYVVLALFQFFVSNHMHKKICPDDKYPVYENSKILLIASVSICLCMFCELLYGFSIIRYVIVLGIIVCAFIFRKKIVLLFKSSKRNK